MRYEMVDICLFEKGDRVHTNEGMATVMEDERVPRDNWEMHYRFVKVSLDNGTELDLSAWGFKYMCDIKEGQYATSRPCVESWKRVGRVR